MCCYSFSNLQTFLDICLNDWVRDLSVNWPKLNRIGIYFQPYNLTAFRRKYINKYIDYVKIYAKDHIYIHYRENNEVHSYKLKLKGNCRLYSSHIHHRNNKNVTMNLITFILINPLNIEEIEVTGDFLSSEEIDALKNSIYYNNKGRYIRPDEISSISDSIQIEIPCSNIVSIHLNLHYLLKLKTCLETCSNTKSINPQCSVGLSLTCRDLNDLVDIKNVHNLITPDLLSHICLTTSKFISKVSSFLESLLKTNKSLISFRYPTSLPFSILSKLLKALPKSTILQTMRDIHENPFMHLDFF